MAGCFGSTPPGVEWYELDYLAVITLRDKICPTLPRLPRFTENTRRNIQTIESVLPVTVGTS
ncbi:MAG: hypothetical protein QOK18_5648 [Mycobacterium sp.]|jgi:hypothetical protein|nr:hypothetical protein [Mycobacterium sp.]